MVYLAALLFHGWNSYNFKRKRYLKGTQLTKPRIHRDPYESWYGRRWFGLGRIHNKANTLGVFTWENSHRRQFHTGMTFWFRIAFTWWLGHFIYCYLKVHFMLLKYTCDLKSQTLRMRYPFQSTDRPISHRNGWSFRVYMIPLRDFVPEWNSRPGTTTGVNSRWGDSSQHDILWYHANKYRATRGNRSELAPARKSPGVM